MKAKHLMTFYAVTLLLYSAWRSFDYMRANLAGVDVTTSMIVSALFIFASEIGLLLWLYYGAPNATTDLQETTAKVMIFVNFVGSMFLGVADLLLHNTIYQINMTWLDPVLLLTPAALVTLNVGAHIVYYLSDSDEQLKREERRLHHAEHLLEIESRKAAVRELNDNREAIAAKLAPAYYGDVYDRITGRTANRFARQAGKLRKKQEAQGNGKVHASETEAVEARPKASG